MASVRGCCAESLDCVPVFLLQNIEDVVVGIAEDNIGLPGSIAPILLAWCCGENVFHVCGSPSGVEQYEPRKPLPIHGPDRKGGIVPGVEMGFKHFSHFWYLGKPVLDASGTIWLTFQMPSHPEGIAHHCVHRFPARRVNR